MIVHSGHHMETSETLPPCLRTPREIIQRPQVILTIFEIWGEWKLTTWSPGWTLTHQCSNFISKLDRVGGRWRKCLFVPSLSDRPSTSRTAWRCKLLQLWINMSVTPRKMCMSIGAGSSLIILDQDVHCCSPTILPTLNNHTPHQLTKCCLGAVVCQRYSKHIPIKWFYQTTEWNLPQPGNNSQFSIFPSGAFHQFWLGFTPDQGKPRNGT